MKNYTPKQFDLPKLEGISASQIEEHIKLYEGYVSHLNAIVEQMSKGLDAFPRQELWRRFTFEFNGMRNHEYYFGALERGPTPFDEAKELSAVIGKTYGGYDTWVTAFKSVATTRGPGWSLMTYDEDNDMPYVHWVDEHHIGHLIGLPVILALDCWEHAYMIDYLPSERSKYIDSYLKNINWNTVNNWFKLAKKRGVQ